MSWVDVFPADPSIGRLEPSEPMFVRPARHVAYAPPPISDAVPETAGLEPTPALDTLLGWWARLQHIHHPSWWTNCRRNSGRNKLQRNLAHIIQICQDHESNGVPAGDPIYQHLYTKGLKLCHWYFDAYHLDRDDIEVEIPSMRQLRLMSHPERVVTVGKVQMVIFGLIAVVILPLIFGAWTGLFGLGQTWIKHLLRG